jgi:hypothetical protein
VGYKISPSNRDGWVLKLAGKSYFSFVSPPGSSRSVRRLALPENRLSDQNFLGEKIVPTFLTVTNPLNPFQ